MLKIVAISHSFRLGPKNFDQKFFSKWRLKNKYFKIFKFFNSNYSLEGPKGYRELADADTHILSLSLALSAKRLACVRERERVCVLSFCYPTKIASLPKAKLAAINLYLGRAIICLSVLFFVHFVK